MYGDPNDNDNDAKCDLPVSLDAQEVPLALQLLDLSIDVLHISSKDRNLNGKVLRRGLPLQRHSLLPSPLCEYPLLDQPYVLLDQSFYFLFEVCAHGFELGHLL